MTDEQRDPTDEYPGDWMFREATKAQSHEAAALWIIASALTDLLDEVRALRRTKEPKR